MKLPCLIFVILLSVFSGTECVLNGELVDSKDLGDYKYLVAILATAKPRTPSEEAYTEPCGGAILNDRLILTAAHCFAKRSDGDIPDYKFLTVIAHTASNRQRLTDASLERNIAKIFVHAGYFQTRHDHDIAIIQLESSLNLLLNFHKVKAVKLPTADFSDGDEAYLAGYGAHKFEGNQRRSDGLLRMMKVKAYADQTLGEMLLIGKPIDESEARGFCAGDSGSPLVVRSKANLGWTTDYTVIGLVKSNKPDCDDRNGNGVYTNVFYYLNGFINKIMADPENVVDSLIKIKDVSKVQSCSNN